MKNFLKTLLAFLVVTSLGAPSFAAHNVQVSSGTNDLVVSTSRTAGSDTFTVSSTQQINAQNSATSYTIQASDIGKTITHNAGSAVADTLPAATTTGFGLGTSFSVINLGNGTVTITPTTSTVNGTSGLALTKGQSAYIISDGTNYYAFLGAGAGGAGSGTVNSATGNQIAYYSGTGTAVSGDANLTDNGTVITSLLPTYLLDPTVTTNAFTVGPTLTAPVFNIADNQATSTSWTGFQIFAKNATGGLYLQTEASDANENMYLESKGTGGVFLQMGTITTFATGSSGTAVTPVASTNAGAIRFNVIPTTDTALTATTNAPLMAVSGAGVVRQHATGALTLQTDSVFGGTTDSFVAASTLTDSAALNFSLKGCGTNATCTNESGIYHASTALTATGTITNSYGINVAADTGATNNYAARFVGPVVNTATVTTGGYTVGTLPTGAIGMRAYVTDATACTFMSTPTGSGSTVCPVFYNGTAWVAE